MQSQRIKIKNSEVQEQLENSHIIEKLMELRCFCSVEKLARMKNERFPKKYYIYGHPIQAPLPPSTTTNNKIYISKTLNNTKLDTRINLRTKISKDKEL